MRASRNCARPRKARPLLPSAPHHARAPFPLTGQQLPCLGQSPFPVHPFGAMMPPPPLYDSGALPPGIMDNTPRKRPRSNPSFGGVGRGSHLTPSPLGGRPGSALGGHHRHRADGRPSSALGGPPGLSIRKINFSTSPSPQPGAENGGGLAPRPTSAPAFRRCISPFGLFKPVATDASNSYLTAINALVNRPQVPLPAHSHRSSAHPPRISQTTNLTPHLLPASQKRSSRAPSRNSLASLARPGSALETDKINSSLTKPLFAPPKAGGAKAKGAAVATFGGGIGSNTLMPQAPAPSARGGARRRTPPPQPPTRQSARGGGAGAKKGAGVNFSVAKKR